MFYTYLWLREDGTPYYVGKGKGNRAYTRHLAPNRKMKAPPKECIVIYPAESEADAFEAEIALIWYYGRKDLGLGCLRNLTNGGEGTYGPKTLEHRLKIGAAHRGMKRTAETKRNIAESHIGILHTEEWKINHSKQLTGRKRPPRSQEWTDNYKRSMKKYWERNKEATNDSSQ
jgi:ribosomal protein L24E